MVRQKPGGVIEGVLERTFLNAAPKTTTFTGTIVQQPKSSASQGAFDISFKDGNSNVFTGVIFDADPGQLLEKLHVAGECQRKSLLQIPGVGNPARPFSGVALNNKIPGKP